jgi:prolyl oligopeptidase
MIKIYKTLSIYMSYQNHLKLSIMNKSTLSITVIFFFALLHACSPEKEAPKEMPEGTVNEKLSFLEHKENFESESQRLAALFEVYTLSQLEASPVMATFMGKEGYNHLWDDPSPEGVQQNLARLKLFNQTANWFDLKDLTEQDKVNFKIYNRTISDQYALYGQFPEQYLIIDQIQGIHNMIPAVIQMMPANSTESIENLLSRLDSIPELLTKLEIILAEGIEKGIVMPRTTVVQVPEQLKQMISDEPEKSIFYAPFSNLNEEINLEGQKSAQERARMLITKGVNPALRRFTQFMEKEYLPNARDSYGLKDLPNGEAWYNERINFYTTTNMTAQEVHDLGLSEVARIKLEMGKLKSEAGFEGDLDAFNTFLREDPQFYFETPEELLIAYRDICKRIDPVLPTLFGKLPRLPYGVKQVPAYSEKATTTAYYQPGSLASGVAGTFFANTYNLKSRPKWEMEALSIHEAVPGHHLQIAIAQELEGLPEFRTMVFFTSFIEGWGLYSESLGPDLGMYKDPYSKYGQLTYEMWRAIRLVVDTGLHMFDWTRQEAIDYFKMNTGKSENDIAVEVDRYIAWPGQALAYKIGELKIKELRKRAEAALANQFDIRAFHDVVLGSGALPLDILEDNVDSWIERQKSKE